MKKTGNAKLDALIDDWRASGRVAFVYPRQKRVSLNGGASKPYQDALTVLSGWKKSHKERPLEAERLITKGRLGGGTFRWIPASEVEAL
jgi:hypothetical protein